jgi:hypothetical protein
MDQQFSLLVKKDADNLIRQVATFGVFRPIVISILGLSLVFSGQIVLGGLVAATGIMPLINALQWNDRVIEQIERGRPLKMKVFFGKRNIFSPFLDLRASLYDPRRYDPINQFFQPHWDLLGAVWNAEPVLGEAQECLVYVDRDSGKLYGFATEHGALFAKPYVLMPWLKLDVAALVSSGQATNFESIQ